MSTRGGILSAIRANQPELTVLPDVEPLKAYANKENLLAQFTTIATNIGAKIYEAKNLAEVKSVIQNNFGADVKIISTISELSDIADTKEYLNDLPVQLADVELTILQSDLAVAENSAIWITEDQMGQRVLPFITQHLAIIVNAKNIVATMHDAYSSIGITTQGFGAFIAGPSKTADIEQSLVIGAHGPRSMSLFLLTGD
ncbi:MAG: LUD domain-containing protein [Bacteroidetes bacterium]|jgi:L-lactate dehydrogenase complex protein LldG|nr:LUD domain-containing protein [Bacteroidota bacterium]